MNKYSLILLVSIIGCSDSNNQENAITNDIGDLTLKFSGKKFTIKEGEFNKSKTRVLILDRHNWPTEDSTINSRLKENGVFATDSIQLKTVVLIYPLKLREVLLDKPATDTPLYSICFIDTDSMYIRKMVDCKFYQLHEGGSSFLADQIINELSVK